MCESSGTAEGRLGDRKLVPSRSSKRCKGSTSGLIYRQQDNADLEKRILEYVVLREHALDMLKQLYELFRMSKPWSRAKAVEAFDLVRVTTLNIVEQILRWRTAFVRPEVFVACGQNYLLKITEDADFLQRFTETKREFGFTLGKQNPFCLPIRASFALKKPQTRGASRQRSRPTVMSGGGTDDSGQDSVCSDRSSVLAQVVLRAEAHAKVQQTVRSRSQTADVLQHVASSKKSYVAHEDKSVGSSLLTPDSLIRPSTVGCVPAERPSLTFEEYQLVLLVLRFSTVPEALQARIADAAKVLTNEQRRSRIEVEGRDGLQRWLRSPYRLPPYAAQIASMPAPLAVCSRPLSGRSDALSPRLSAAGGSRTPSRRHGGAPRSPKRPNTPCISARSSITPRPRTSQKEQSEVEKARQLHERRFRGVPTTHSLRVGLGVYEPPKVIPHVFVKPRPLQKPLYATLDYIAPHQMLWRKAKHGTASYVDQDAEKIKQRLDHAYRSLGTAEGRAAAQRVLAQMRVYACQGSDAGSQCPPSPSGSEVSLATTFSTFDPSVSVLRPPTPTSRIGSFA